jgi:hypothetical protein
MLRWYVNNAFEKDLKGSVSSLIEELSRRLLGGTEKKHGNFS